MKASKQRSRITLHIEQDLKENLFYLANRDGRSLNNYIIQLIKRDVAATMSIKESRFEIDFRADNLPPRSRRRIQKKPCKSFGIVIPESLFQQLEKAVSESNANRCVIVAAALSEYFDARKCQTKAITYCDGSALGVSASRPPVFSPRR